MKAFILSTVAATALALTAGTAMASSGENRSRDDNFDVFLQSQGQSTGHRSFLSGSEDYGYYRAHPRHYRYEMERPNHWWFW